MLVFAGVGREAVEGGGRNNGRCGRVGSRWAGEEVLVHLGILRLAVLGEQE